MATSQSAANNNQPSHQTQSDTRSSSGSQLAPTVVSPLFGQRRQSMLDNDENEQLLTIPRSISQSQIQYAFSLIDINQDGLIDIRELNHMLANLGIPLEDSLLERIIGTASKRGDSRISEEEFLDWISHFIQLTDNLPDKVAASSSTQSRSENHHQCTSNTSTHATVANRSPEISSSNSLICTNSPTFSRASLKSRRHSFGRSSKAYQAATSATNVTSSSSSYDNNFGNTEDSSSSQANKNHQQHLSETKQELHREQSLEKDCESDLRAAFKVFDLDGNGYITIDEIRSGLMLIGENLTEKELKDLLRGTKCSENSHMLQQTTGSSSAQLSDNFNEGKINIDEFVKLII